MVKNAATGSSSARSSRRSTGTRGRPRCGDRQGRRLGRLDAAFVGHEAAQKGSVIAMKRHCTSYLPHYMIPDSITFLSDLPTTSTDKVDYQGLKAAARRDDE